MARKEQTQKPRRGKLSKIPFSGTDATGRERRRNTKVGLVVSNKMNKTVVVAVESLVIEPMYKKYVKRTSKFLAHCEQNNCNVGDRVLIEETRPLSKRKRWNVREVLEKASEV